jgi:hypothetical protein
LIKEILYGIQATKDVKLSNISRSLNEQQPLIKTEDRLSRNLDDVDFTDGINREICRLGASKVLDDMVIVLDFGDWAGRVEGAKLEVKLHNVMLGRWLIFQN